jgi:hypothetical protein
MIVPLLAEDYFDDKTAGHWRQFHYKIYIEKNFTKNNHSQTALTRQPHVDTES